MAQYHQPQPIMKKIDKKTMCCTGCWDEWEPSDNNHICKCSEIYTSKITAMKWAEDTTEVTELPTPTKTWPKVTLEEAREQVKKSRSYKGK